MNNWTHAAGIKAYFIRPNGYYDKCEVEALEIIGTEERRAKLKTASDEPAPYFGCHDRADSNRLLGLQVRALPISYGRGNMVRLGGLEPPTSTFAESRSSI